MIPARAKISPKRWANIRSDLAAAIDASGLRPMLKTADIKLDETWRSVLANAQLRIARGLSRFARWSSLRQIAPQAVQDSSIERFVAELDDATLVRKLRYVRRFVSKRWNELVASKPGCGLRPVNLKDNERVLRRVPWKNLADAFRHDADRYLEWGSMPDPLAKGARARALGPRTLRLQREHIHSAASAAIAAGIPVGQLISLAMLVRADTFRPAEAALAAGRTQAVGLHTWSCNHPHRDRFGMGEGAPRCDRYPQGIAEETRHAAIRFDRKESSRAANVR